MLKTVKKIFNISIIIIFFIILSLVFTSTISGLELRLYRSTSSSNFEINEMALDSNVFNSKNHLIKKYNQLGNNNLLKISNKWQLMSDIDDNTIIFGDDGFLYVYDINTGDKDEHYMDGEIIFFPKISGNKVIYFEVYFMGFKMYNIETGKKLNLFKPEWHGGGADDYQFFYPYIVYENGIGLLNKEIFFYNIETGENIQLSDSPGNDYSEKPAIYDNIIVWQEWEVEQDFPYRPSQCDIRVYNIDTQEFTQVTNTPTFEYETSPTVYENNIVFSYHQYDKTGEDIIDIHKLKSYDIETGIESTIFEDSANSPEVYENLIVYSRGGILCLYDLNTNEDIVIITSSDLIQPWNVWDDFVVFNVMDDGIYLYSHSGNLNSPPKKPDILAGPINGKTGMRYEYSTFTTEPDGDDIRYGWDWNGDGKVDEWTSYFPSGEEIHKKHAWNIDGGYDVKVIAEDRDGQSSEWSDPLTVTMPKCRLKKLTLFTNIHYLYPNLFSILQRFL